MSSGDTYDLSPSKRTLRSLKSDVTPIAAVKELVDNVIDNWRRLGDEETDVTIDIDIDFENDTFRIEDNSGGLTEENVKKIFALGGSTKEEIEYSIGSYGMGAKKAIVRLGSNAEIKSRSTAADHGYGFVITEEWLHDSGWTVDKQVYEDLPLGSTVIEIDDLNIKFDDDNEVDEDESSSESEETSAFESSEELINSLREELTETYAEFLSGRAGPENGELTIKVNGRSIDSPAGVDWSFTPYDSFYPRYFKKYEISSDDLPNRDEPVEVDVIAGIMPTGEMEKSGTDIIIQNRRILTATKGEMGGWGDHLKNHHDNIARVRFILKIHAENHPEDLPWDTQKGRVETNNNIARRAFNFLRRAAEEYTEARYEYFPTPFSAPYDEESETLPRSSPEELDYSSRTQVINDHKPDSGFSQKDQLSDLAKYHRNLRVTAPNLLTELYRPAYEPCIENVDIDEEADIDEDADIDDLWDVPEAVHNYSERRLHLWLKVVKETAEGHAESGTRIQFDDQSPWWQTYYNKIIEESEKATEEVENTGSVSEVENKVDARKEAQEIPGQILESSELRANDTWSETESEPESVEEESDTAEQEEIDGREDEGEEGQAEQGESQEPEEDSDEDGEEEDDGTEIPDFGSTVGREVRGSSDKERKILITVPESRYEEICEELNLEPEDVTARRVGEAIVEQGLELSPYLDSEHGTEAEAE